jgi:DNA-binding transcriptional ArsR family regulator
VARGDSSLEGFIDQLEKVEDRLNRIENLILSQQSEMDEVRSLFVFFRGSLRFYDEVSHLLSYVSSFKKATKHGWVLKDEIAKEIILDLARKGPRNISQLTRDLREDRGTASRRIVAERVQRLIECGVIRESQKGAGRRLELAGQAGDDSPDDNR